MRNIVFKLDSDVFLEKTSHNMRYLVDLFGNSTFI